MQKKTVSEAKAVVAEKVNEKVAVVKAQEKKVEEKAAEKATEVKKEVKTAATEVKEEVKTAAKAATVKAAGKVAETKTAAKKAVKKTTTKAAAKVTAVKDDFQTDVFIQFANQEAVEKDIILRAKEAYVAEGHKLSSIKSLQIYIKPEDDAAYYVVNKKSAGRIDLF